MWQITDLYSKIGTVFLRRHRSLSAQQQALKMIMPAESKYRNGVRSRTGSCNSVHILIYIASNCIEISFHWLENIPSTGYTSDIPEDDVRRMLDDLQHSARHGHSDVQTILKKQLECRSLFSCIMNMAQAIRKDMTAIMNCGDNFLAIVTFFEEPNAYYFRPSSSNGPWSEYW